MQAGTKILIERMKTNPEEFIDGKGSKWGRALTIANNWLPDEDKEALNEAVRAMRIDSFNEEVLRTLANEPEEKTITSGRYSTGWTDPLVFTSTQPSPFGAVPKAEGQMVEYQK